MRRSLRRITTRNFGQDVDEDAPIARLRHAGNELREWRDHAAAWRRPAGFDRVAQIDHLLDAIGTFSQISQLPPRASDPLHRDTEPLRRAWAEIGPVRERGFDDYDGWEAALCGLAARERDLRRRSSASGQYSKEVPRAQVVAARDMIVDGAGGVPRPRRCRSGGARPRGAAAGDCRLRGPQAARWRRGLSRSPHPRPRPGARSRARPPRFPAPLPLPAGRRVPGHRSAAGRAAAAAGRRRIAAGRERPVRSAGAPWRALHRRRPEAVDLPVSPGRRRRLPRDLRVAGRRRRGAGPAANVVPKRPGDPTGRQRRVQRPA